MKSRFTPLPVLLVLLLGQAAWGSTLNRLHKHPYGERHASRNRIVARLDANPAVALDDEEQRYAAAKEAAKTDPAMQALKARSDAATGEEEGREAAITYYRALFQKIRDADKTLTDRADLAEAALLRRFND